MKQTEILLLGSREDYEMAMNMLTLVKMHAVTVDIEDVMLAYVIALDWCEWIKDPKTVPENHPVKEIELLTPMLSIFERCVSDLEKELMLHQFDLENLFNNLNGNLIRFWRSNSPLTGESVRIYHRTLRLTAKFFAEKMGDDHFNEILKEKVVPPMS